MIAWLDTLSAFWLHVATFVLMFLEGMGIPGIPGVLPMLALAESIHAGRTTLTEAIAWGTAGNWLGSLAGYQAAHLALKKLPPHWQETARSPKAASVMHRFGGLAVVVSRTVGSLRTPVTLYAGASAYPWRPYIGWSLLGALVHIGVWQTLLWRYGPAILRQFEARQHELMPYVLAALVVAALLWGGKMWREKRQKLPIDR